MRLRVKLQVSLRAVIEDNLSIDERDDLDLKIPAPGALGMAGMHGGFSKPRCGAGNRCSDPLKGSYLGMMSAPGAFDSGRAVAVGI